MNSHSELKVHSTACTVGTLRAGQPWDAAAGCSNPDRDPRDAGPPGDFQAATAADIAREPERMTNTLRFRDLPRIASLVGTIRTIASHLKAGRSDLAAGVADQALADLDRPTDRERAVSTNRTTADRSPPWGRA